ncbi:MAG: quinone oxidoreductase [Caldilineaceae bacterium]|nr:quinone oxidoreductase [Caldilineaceae bacterium]MDE0337748.1 quinone oxidoreductase [Caldilineaceae bacterium]
MKAIQVQEVGDPNVLQYVDAPTPEPGAGEARVKIEVAGVNFIDTYHRRGWYPLPLPFTPGVEGAGIVDAVGEGVTEVAVGDAVAYGMSTGSYAEYAIVPSRILVHRPAGVNAQHGAAAMIQGMTAHYLACSTYPLKPGDTCLVHAAAGGTGALLVQIAKLRGARVLGTVSTDEKARIAEAAGADATIRYTEVDFAEAVRDLTDGEGVEVVYDSVGIATFDKSLDCLKPRGYMVLFGQASGVVPTLDPQVLNQKGSLFLTRPTLASHMLTRSELEGRASDVFNWIAEGNLEFRIDRTFPLEDAEGAHTYLEARQTKGKVLLTT